MTSFSQAVGGPTLLSQDHSLHPSQRPCVADAAIALQFILSGVLGPESE